MRKYLVILPLIFITLFISSCKDTSEDKNNEQFIPYISAYTSGVISNNDVIIIRLAEEQTKKIDLPEGIFEFDPKIEGNAYWQDNRTIIFEPVGLLPSNVSFKGIFHLKEIINVPDELAEFHFEFKTKPLFAELSTKGIESYSNTDLTWNILNGELILSDYADIEKIEQALSVSQNGVQKNVRWTHNEDLNTHLFTVDSIKREEKTSYVEISLDEDVLPTVNQLQEKVKIPGINDFSVLNIVVKQSPDQIVYVYFSDPIDPNQDLNGLIYFESGEDIKLSVEGNAVKIFPKTRLKGEKKLIITTLVKNVIHKPLQKEVSKKVTFVNLKPNVSAVNKGVILPKSNQVIFPFQAVNLKAVNVKIFKIFENNIHQFFQTNQFDDNRELTRTGRVVYKGEVELTSDKKINYGSWNNFGIDLTKLINVEPGAIYRVSISFEKKHSLYDCDEEDTNDNLTDIELASYDDEDLNNVEGPENNYYYYYDDEYDYYYYDYKNRENPCKKSYYYNREHRIAQNIFASNFGIIAKEDNQHQLRIYITDLLTLESEENVDVSIYNYQKQLIFKGTTDNEGTVTADIKKKPFLLVARKGNEYGYLRLDDGSALSTSAFDVNGYKLNKGVKGFIYTERGVWRPGDSLYISFILEDKNKTLSPNHPVVMELYTPNNQLFARKVKTTSVNNFYDFRTSTPIDAPTGNWLAKIKVGANSFTKSIKIETVKPNRLKILFNHQNKILSPTNQTLQLHAEWLHGGSAANYKAIVEMRLAKGKTSFEKYEDYNFDDPSKSLWEEEKTIFDGKLNEQGNASIPLNIKINDAPGMVNVHLKSRVFEPGGDFSINRTTIPFSPYTTYVGLKIPAGTGWNNSIDSEKPTLIPIVTLNENGKPVSGRNLKIEVYEISWRWWWQRDGDENLGYYIRSNSSKKIIYDYVESKNGRVMYELKFPQPTWGRKFIRITDIESGHSTGQIFYTSYNDFWNDDKVAPEAAEMLSFSTDKEKYSPGETVTLNLPANKAKALISVENGSKIISSFWQELSEDNHTVEIETTPEMAPNVYIHISYIQPYNHSENDRPIRLYGIRRVFIEDPNTHLTPVINMPDKLRPETETTIKISEKEGKPMTYTIALVDEGLLDLTNFKTPNSWKYFYATEALGVKTYDMYRFVMGAFNGELAGVYAIGGDEELIKPGTKKINRFKPMVRFLGPFELSSNSTNKHQISIPNYIGSVRTMVIAGNKDFAYGSAEKTTRVVKPLMVLGTMPRTLSPTEKITVPVTVFAMENKVKNVSVKISTNSLLKVTGASSKNITFNNKGEKVVYFTLEAARKIGVAKVHISVSGNGENAYDDIALNVKIPSPEISETRIVKLKSKWDTIIKPIGIQGTNHAQITISNYPNLNLGHRLNYLIHYPYGCIEQTVSSAFPQLYLNDLVELSKIQKDETQSNIENTLKRLKMFQTPSGGFTYWPESNSDIHEWATSYAGHFMLEAKKKGFLLPANMLKKWMDYQKHQANKWSPKYNAGYKSELTQAYRLFTLALAGKPEIGAMNRLRENGLSSNISKWLLVNAYYVAGKKTIAEKMMPAEIKKILPYRDWSYTFGSDIRDEAIILYALVNMKKWNMTNALIKSLSKNLNSNRWMSTQETAFSLLALSKYVLANGKGNISADIKIGNKTQHISSNKSSVTIPVNTFNKPISVVNKNTNSLIVELSNYGKPLTYEKTGADNSPFKHVWRPWRTLGQQPLRGEGGEWLEAGGHPSTPPWACRPKVPPGKS